MAAIDCLDIFDAVYSNTKRCFLEKLDTVKVRSKTVTQNSAEDEQKSKATVGEPATVTEINSVESEGSVTETVKESVERVSESDATVRIRKEIEEKFPYALASVCAELQKLDLLYRERTGGEAQGEFSHYFIDVTDKFPLSEIFVFPCIMYISSFIVIDVDEKKSDALFEKYTRSVSSISALMPFETGKTVEKYPY